MVRFFSIAFYKEKKRNGSVLLKRKLQMNLELEKGKYSYLVFSSGKGTWMARSNLPGLRSALSSLSGRFVAANTITSPFLSKPSENLFSEIRKCHPNGKRLRLMKSDERLNQVRWEAGSKRVLQHDSHFSLLDLHQLHQFHRKKLLLVLPKCIIRLLDLEMVPSSKLWYRKLQTEIKDVFS